MYKLGRRARAKLIERALLDEAAPFEDGDRVGQDGGLPQVVGDVEAVVPRSFRTARN